MNQISVVDEPNIDITTGDALSTGRYAKTLSDFIRSCDTPLTIGVQGEWGSGKTSLLKMIQANLDASVIKTKGRAEDLAGTDVYRVIWINTWEHSILKSPEEALISILSEIIDEIVAVDGQWETARKAKKFLGKIAKGAIKFGAASTMGSGGVAVADEFIGDEVSSNTVRELRNTLQETVDTIISRSQNPVQKFVVFVDDLDRLDPPEAVKVLELLKNIFSVKNCVYVLAVDYQVVVKGLREKFGKMNEQNEWEFRAFFDKIIQVPFMMPMGAYNLESYIKSIFNKTSYLSTNELKGVGGVESLAPLIQLTVGRNPRALKRMANSLSLINLFRLQDSNDLKKDVASKQDDATLKAMMLGLVCIQIAFPKVYDLLARKPSFVDWDDNFVAEMTQGTAQNDKHLEVALSRAMDYSDEDFDENWEQALFKIVWANSWQRNRVVEISRALSILKDRIVRDEERLGDLMFEAVKLTSVTSVITTEEKFFCSDQEHQNDEKNANAAFWRQVFSKLCERDPNSIFSNSGRAPFISSGAVYRQCDEFRGSRFFISTNVSSFIGFEIRQGDESDNIALFSFLERMAPVIKERAGASVKVKIKPGQISQSLTVSCPNKALNGMRGSVLALNKTLIDAYADDMVSVLFSFEQIIRELVSEFMDMSNDERVSAIGAVESTTAHTIV